MDRDSEQTIRVLSALVQTTRQLFKLSETLAAQPEVAKVSDDFQWSTNHAHSEFKVGSSYLLDWYVDAELVTGRSLVWILELTWPDDLWTIESRIETTGSEGLQPLRVFPIRTARTIDELLSQLQVATSELVDSSNFPLVRG